MKPYYHGATKVHYRDDRYSIEEYGTKFGEKRLVVIKNGHVEHPVPIGERIDYDVPEIISDEIKEKVKQLYKKFEDG